MINANPGYITLDLGGATITASSQTITGLYEKLTEAINTDKEVRFVNFVHPVYGMITNPSATAIRGDASSVTVSLPGMEFTVTSLSAVTLSTASDVASYKAGLNADMIDVTGLQVVAGTYTISGIRNAVAAAITAGRPIWFKNVTANNPFPVRAINLGSNSYRISFDHWVGDISAASTIVLSEWTPTP